MVQYNLDFTNKFPDSAYIYAFIDKNRNNVFSADEGIMVKVGPGINQNMVLSWRNLNIQPGNYTIRFRITTDTLVDNPITVNEDERSFGLARNGEVTDRIVRILPIEALPLQLIKFAGSVQPRGNKLTWETAKEQDILHFELERSLDARTWSKIHQVAAHNQMQNNYSFEDLSANKTTYYRLKIVEANTHSYSPILLLDQQQKELQKWTITPTLVLDKVTVSSPSTNSNYSVIDVNGKTVHTFLLNEKNVIVDLSQLQPGNYFITDGYQTEKITKQ